MSESFELINQFIDEYGGQDANRIREAIEAECTARVKAALESMILNLAERILKAADYEAPKWPADASADALGYKRGADLSQLREAMLADPIIRAAIALRQWHDLNGQEPIAALTRVVDAVRAAGL